MCGIFGILAKEGYYNKTYLLKILENLAKLSQVRGKDSSGLAYRFESAKKIRVIRGPVSIDELLKTKDYKKLKQEILSETKTNSNNIFAALGHARLVTNGTQLEDENNQPVIKGGIVGVHNGIIVNEIELWDKNNDLIREYEIDTEILFALIRKNLNIDHSRNQFYPTSRACTQSISEIFGTVSTGFMLNDLEEFVVFTNNGSLYTLTNKKDIFIFGS